MQKELKDHTCINANQEIEAKAWFSYPTDPPAKKLPVATDNIQRSVPKDPGASAMDRRRTQICSKCIYRIVQFSTILPLNMDQIVLLEYVVTAHDVHIKVHVFHRRLACKVELSSTLQASRRSMPGIDNCVGEKYLHMPQRCPRYVGGI